MTTRFDVLAITEGKPTTDGSKPKTFFTKVGAMFPLRNGEGFSIRLDAVPLSGSLIAKPPGENQGHGGDDFPG